MEIIEILKAMCNKKDAQSLERLLKDKTTKEVENILRNIEYNEHRFRLLVSEKTYKHILNAVQLGRRLYCMPGSPGTQVSSVKDAANLFSHIMWENQERFVIAILNCKNIVLETRTVSIGTATETLASPRDIFREVIRHGATRMIIAHNHPSGNLDPSEADIELTKQLLLGAQLLNIPILDHLILGNGNYRSLRENTSLWIDFPQED